jgi:hypothetical protein
MNQKIIDFAKALRILSWLAANLKNWFLANPLLLWDIERHVRNIESYKNAHQPKIFVYIALDKAYNARGNWNEIEEIDNKYSEIVNEQYSNLGLILNRILCSYHDWIIDDSWIKYIRWKVVNMMQQFWYMHNPISNTFIFKDSDYIDERHWIEEKITDIE